MTTKSAQAGRQRQDRLQEFMKLQNIYHFARLCLSPQCGFASCEIGNKLTEEEQWAKLDTR